MHTLQYVRTYVCTNVHRTHVRKGIHTYPLHTNTMRATAIVTNTGLTLPDTCLLIITAGVTKSSTEHTLHVHMHSQHHPHTDMHNVHILTHLLLDYAAERKRHIRTIHINYHQGTLHSFFLWAIVDDFVYNAGRKSSTADFLLALFCGLSFQCQEIFPYDLQGINYITT